MISRELLRVAVLTSWRVDGLDGLFTGDGNYEVVAGVVTEPCSPAANILDRYRVPRVLRDLRGFCLRRGVPLADSDARRVFDAQTADWLKTFQPDLVVLCGYGYLLANPILASWPNRVIGVHDADLRIRTAGGAPRYPGLRAVRDAICAGEKEIRSTIYLITPKIDAGPSLVVSPPYPVSLPIDMHGSEDGMGTYVAVYREQLIKDSWGTLLRKAIVLFSENRVEVTADGRAFIDGLPAPIVAIRRSGRTDPLQAV